MSEKTITGAGKELLQVHSELYIDLVKIPESRQIGFRIDIENKLPIGKPRFEPPEYQWPPELLQRLRDHLQNIWVFFEKYSFWFDKSIYPLVSWEEGRISKESIIFLLQHDVWGASAVYGAYLIEKETKQTIISYYRREKKIKSFYLNSRNESQIGEWIKKDAIRQITDHFTFLWQKLENEIKVCMTERYQKKEKEAETSEYLFSQFAICGKLLPISREGSLLLLGRIAEHWLKIALNISHPMDFIDLIHIASNVKILDKNERRMFNTIRNYYNDLKHDTTYDIIDCPLEELQESFEIFLLNTKKSKKSNQK